MCVYACVCALVRAFVSKHVHTHVHRANKRMHTEHIYVRAHNTHMHKTAKSGYAYPVCLLSGALGHLCTTQVNFSNKSWKQDCGGYIMLHKSEHLNYHLNPTCRGGGGYQNFGGQICYYDILVWRKIVKARQLRSPLAQPSLTHHETQNNFARFSLHSWVDRSNN